MDDEAPLRGILRISLDYFGVEVVGEAGNGEEALEAYQKLQPNVVIMDINMPKMDGLEALQEIRKVDPRAVIVMMTASDDESMKLEAIKYGCRGFLRKPLKMDELHQDILTNLRVYFAEEKGEKLDDDYYRYQVKPEWRSDEIKREQGLAVNTPKARATPISSPAAITSPVSGASPAPAAPAPVPAAPPPAPPVQAAPPARPVDSDSDPQALLLSVLQEENRALKDENDRLKDNLRKAKAQLEAALRDLG